MANNANIFESTLKDIYFKILRFINISYIYSHTFVSTAWDAFWAIYINKIPLEVIVNLLADQDIGVSFLVSLLEILFFFSRNSLNDSFMYYVVDSFFLLIDTSALQNPILPFFSSPISSSDNMSV